MCDALSEAAAKDAKNYVEKFEKDFQVLIDSAKTQRQKEALILQRDAVINNFESKTKKAYLEQSYSRNMAIFELAEQNGGELPETDLPDDLRKIKKFFNSGRADLDAVNADAIQVASTAKGISQIVNACDAYKKENDPSGMGLIGLVLQAQALDSATRKNCVEMLGRRVRKEKDGSPWGAEAEKAFYAEFDKACIWFDAAKQEDGEYEDSRVVDYYAFRDDFMKMARARGLNPSQALAELQTNPYYKRMRDERGLEIVRYFFSGL